jgi:protein SCO1/2
MNSTAVRIWAFVLLGVVAAYGVFSAYRYWKPGDEMSTTYIGEPTKDPDYVETKDPPKDKDLRFFERNGREFKFSEMDGKLWVASFFFTACPSECRILNNEIAKLRLEYKDKDVTFVSITCDPDNDSLEALRKYAAIYGADPDRWLFVRGDPDYTSFLGLTKFKVSVVKQSHSDQMILIKPDGTIEDYYSSKQAGELLKIRKAIDGLLEEAPPAEKVEEGSGT